MKKTLSFFIAVLLLYSAVLPTTAALVSPIDDFAEKNTSYMENLDILKPEEWKAGVGVDSINSRHSGEGNILFVSSENATDEMQVIYSPEKPLDLSPFNEICFDIHVSNVKSFDLSVTFYYDGGSYTDKAECKENGRNAVIFPLPKENKLLNRIEIVLYGKSIRSFTIVSIKADDKFTYSYEELFGCQYISEMQGKAEFREDSIILNSYEVNGQLELSLAEDRKEESFAVLVDAESNTAGLLSIKNPETSVSSSLPVYSGRTVYTFIVDKVGKKLEIDFSGADNSGKDSFTLYGIKYISLGKGKSIKPGVIEGCTYDEDTLSVKGTLSNNAVVEYINATLALYELMPFEELNSINVKTEPVAEMSMSTSFELSYSADIDFTDYRYVAAIRLNDKVIPISEPLFALAKTNKLPMINQVRAGIDNVGTAMVFECGVGDAVIEFDCNRLFDVTEASATVRYAGGDYVYYLNSDYIHEVYSDVDFCVSTDSRVYLKLTETESVFSSDLEAGLETVYAVAGIIGERFPQISGVVLLSDYVYPTDSGTGAEYAAYAVGEFISSLRKTGNSAEIIVSINEENSYNAVLLSYYFKHIGINDVSVMIETDGNLNSLTLIKTITDASSYFGCDYKYSFANMRPLTTDGADQKFFELYYNAERMGISGVLLSPDGMVEDNVLINMFSGIREESSKFYEFNANSAVGYSFLGRAPLWDFTDSYSTFGWLAGGSCSDPETVKNPMGKGRAMKSSLSSENDGEGILVCWLEDDLKLSSTDGITVKYVLEAGITDSMPVSIVLGARNSKARYSISAFSGSNEIYLDISEYPEIDKLEYMAIIVNAPVDAELYIESIDAVSQKYDKALLETAVFGEKLPDANYGVAVMFAFTIISVTLIVFAVLSRRKGWEKIEKKSEKKQKNF